MSRPGDGNLFTSYARSGLRGAPSDPGAIPGASTIFLPASRRDARGDRGGILAVALDAPAPDLLPAILDRLPGIVYVYDLEHGQNLYISPAWHREFGYSEAETRADSGRLLARIIHPDDLPAVARHHAALAASPDDEIRSLRYRVLRRGGGVVWLESQDRPLLRDAAGRVTRIVGYARDVTALEQQAQALTREAALRAAIIDNAVEGICVCEDCDAPPGIHFSLWNQRMTEISGYTVDEINRLGWYQTVYTDPETQARAADRMARMRQGEDLAAEEWQITRKDGQRRTLLISTRVFVTDRPRVLGVMHDVTERNALQERVRSAERLEAIGRLAGAVAHDFNNLLTVIRGTASILKRAPGLADADRNLLADLDDAAARGAALTGRLLAVGRRQRTELRPLELNAVIAPVLSDARRVLGDQVSLTHTAEPDLHVRGDGAQLEQVLVNLLRNAREAMPGGGLVRVATRRASATSSVELVVTDTGHGVAPEHLPHLFEPFFTTKPEAQSAGLGLATAHAIVTAHGGSISVRSAPGAGATFTVSLPAEATAPPRPVDDQVAPGRSFVLVVEDQPVVRRTVEHMLQARGHRFVSAGTSTEALALFDRHRHELTALLTDVALGPGESGTQLGERVLAQRPDLRVVYMSGFDPAPSARPLRGSERFLPKPFSGDDLDAALRAPAPERGAPAATPGPAPAR